MKQTINRISNRVGDWFATLFALTAPEPPETY